MQQTFEYYIVDPGTWKDLKKIDCVKSSTISRDSDAETLGSASFAVTDMLSECYIRTYLVTVQNGVTQRHVLGTHLVQTPSSKFNGRVKDITLDGYTPLLELKENLPPIGYFVPRDTKDAPSYALDWAYRLTREHVRAPVVKPFTHTAEELRAGVSDMTKVTYEFTPDTSSTWLSYINDLIANQTFDTDYDKLGRKVSSYTFDVDEMGEILFAPVQDLATMQPRWTYTDDNSSILQPDVSMEHDLYGIPNVVEVIYTSNTDNVHYRAVNNDPNSPISVQRRGREIVHRVVNPSFPAAPYEEQIREYAEQLLKAMSTLTCTVTYTHGYCPVRLNDCVLLNYERAGLKNVRAKVISQNIKCEPGCQVTEKAVFIIKLWEGKAI
jgi:hypothetical protein